ncbi:MAG TPA: glycosyltransferase family 39 protein [Phycisphaerae bacterium]|nr:glycosyltransferase family 39 protein [Phycisphaerae bacterium]HOJ73836.1 glycosyltransferase family 39 protein [Phycisphaerae bacterium]HOM50777.1 glycosyltransferase family 39 protein [Phycisphaerae bacterium]HON65153.1 glycosyltransferase family 39 protein [Phycisphaerae bacterium]HOQ85822.1 glycosyltransferase family 39 protein [Phycisphaerae bacterium]
MSRETPQAEHRSEEPPVPSASSVQAVTRQTPPFLAAHAGWAGILVLALVWRLLGITTTEVWRDEATTIIHTYGGWLDLMLRLPRIEDTPPLGFLLFKAWATISREEWFLRLLPVLLGTAWVDVIMRTARLIHPRAWWPAGLLAAFSHMPIHFSQEIRSYALLTLLTALCFWAVERSLAAKSPRPWLFALAVFGAMTAHSHMAGVFVFPAVVLYLLIRAGGRWRDVAHVGPLALWVLLILPLVWFARYWSNFHQTTALDAWWVPPITLNRARYIAERFFGLDVLRTWSLSEQTTWATWLSFAAERVVLLGSALLTALGLTDERTRRPVAAFAAALAAFLAAMYVSGLLTLPNMLDRTLLPAWTPVVLGLGAAAASSRVSWARPVCAVTVVVMAALWAASWVWQAQAGPPRRPPAEELFGWMRSNISPNDLVYSTPRWYKENTVYYLMDTIAADQLLDEFDAYRGKPMRHRLAIANPREWPERFASKLRAHRERYGDDFSIWIVWWAGIRTSGPDAPEHLILSGMREVDRREIFATWPLSIVRYRPEPPASRPE